MRPQCLPAVAPSEVRECPARGCPLTATAEASARSPPWCSELVPTASPALHPSTFVHPAGSFPSSADSKSSQKAYECSAQPERDDASTEASPPAAWLAPPVPAAAPPTAPPPLPPAALPPAALPP